MAMASPGGGSGGRGGGGNGSATITASTSVSSHSDTTSGSVRTACTSSVNGPVWALDTYTSTLSALPDGTNTWKVTIQDKGSFSGFADPNTCDALKSKGSLLGLYTVTVTSANAPDPSNLQSSYSGDVGTTQMVQDFFNDPAAQVAGGDYFFVYQGGNYVQTTSSLYGDVVASH